MKNRNLVKIVSVAAVLLFALANISAQSAKPAPTRGLLYKISGKKLQKPSYIYGTIHIICPTDMFSMDKLNSYFSQTDGLVMELDMDDPAVTALMAKGLNMPEGKRLQDLLTPEKYAKVDEMFKTIFGVPVDRLKQFTPQGISMIVTTNPKAIGCAKPESYEGNFVAMAAKEKKSVEGLESVEDQVATLAQTPLEKQAENLYQLSLDPEKAFATFKKLVETYKLQDSEKLYQMMTSESAEAKDAAAKLLDGRNKNWIPKIEKYIAEKSRFIAVGGGHLGGEKGVLNLLKKKGYKIEAIRF